MDFLDDTLCKMSKGFECLKSTANMGLGFCCSVGEAALNRGKNSRRSGKARTSLFFFAHFSLFTGFVFSLLFTQTTFLCGLYSDHFHSVLFFISIGNIVFVSHNTNCEVVNYMVIEYRCRLLEDGKKMRTNPQNEINENARKPKLKSQYVSRQNYLKIKLKSWVQRPKEDPVSITITDTSLQEPEARKPKYKVRKTYFLKLGQGPEYSYPNLWMYLFL